MRIRQIGSTVFDNNTNIVVNATALDAVGGGFRVNDLYGPQPFAVEVAFVRSTRQLALRALNTLASELYIRSQRRISLRLNVAGGVDVIVEDEAGNATLRATLTNASVTLISIENTATGVIARARVNGTLLGPFAASSLVSQTISSLKAYELRTVTLTNIDDFTLAIHNIETTIVNSTGLRNALYVFETLESATATSRIYRKSPSSVSSNLVLENFNAGGTTTLQRARFTANGNGTITYNLANSEVPIDIFNLFFEVYLPSVPPSDVLYTISWSGQPAITGIVDFSRTFINVGIYARAYSATTVTIQITNALTNTYVSPLLFIPTEGVFTYNATSTNLSRFSAYNPATEDILSLAASGSTEGELRGPPGFIGGKYLAIFSGMMISTIANLDASVTIYSRRIEPASFV
jgi:hypothetical protein